jgi:hypothetical protein
VSDRQNEREATTDARRAARVRGNQPTVIDDAELLLTGPPPRPRTPDERAALLDILGPAAARYLAERARPNTWAGSAIPGKKCHGSETDLG